MDKKTLRRLANHGLRFIPSKMIPFPVFSGLAGNGHIFPFYHLVSDAALAHVRHLFSYRNTREFKKDLDFFLRHYTPLSLSDLLTSIENEGTLPGKSFLLSFDDGFREIYDTVAPILRERGVPATFFLNSAFLDNKHLFYRHKASVLVDVIQKSNQKTAEKIKGIFLEKGLGVHDLEASILSLGEDQAHILDDIAARLEVDFDEYLAKVKPYLKSEQVAELVKEGFTIGGHSIDHPNYAALSIPDQMYQTSESVRLIRERFALDYSAFAFPFRDRGISKKYFDKMFNGMSVDISFGTSGMIDDIFPRSIQRFWMEDIPAPAKTIVAMHYALRLLRQLAGRNRMRRV